MLQNGETAAHCETFLFLLHKEIGMMRWLIYHAVREKSRGNDS